MLVAARLMGDLASDLNLPLSPQTSTQRQQVIVLHPGLRPLKITCLRCVLEIQLP